MGKTARRGGSGKPKPAAKSAADGRGDGSKQKKARGRRACEGGGGGGVASELSVLGLRVKHMPEDGACLFHALNDQLYGQGGGDHRALRRRVMDYVAQHRDQFEPFVEDDEPFDKYVARMREDSMWAGNLELQAASLVLGANVRIYQAGQPAWTVKNFPEKTAPLLHLSYEDGQHYNSVRMAGDYGSGPPEPVVLAQASAAVSDPGASVGAPDRGRCSDSRVAEVAAGAGCSDRAQVEAALQRCGGDAAAAIEALIEEVGPGARGEDGAGALPSCAQGTAATAAEAGGEAPAAAAATGGAAAGRIGVGEERAVGEERVSVQLVCSPEGRVAVELRVAPAEGDVGGGIGLVGRPHRKAVRLRQRTNGRREKEPSRNGPCPCGSKRKYKSCCGAAAATARRREGTATVAAGAGSGATGAATAGLQELYI